MTDKIKRSKEERPSLKRELDGQLNGKGHIKASVLKRMARYLMEHKLMILLCFFMMLLSNVLALVAPKLSAKAIDAIEPGLGLVDMKKVDDIQCCQE